MLYSSEFPLRSTASEVGHVRLQKGSSQVTMKCLLKGDPPGTKLGAFSGQAFQRVI